MEESEIIVIYVVVSGQKRFDCQVQEKRFSRNTTSQGKRPRALPEAPAAGCIVRDMFLLMSGSKREAPRDHQIE